MKIAVSLLLATTMAHASVVASKPSVAVIGGGIAGLSCAKRLLQLDIPVTVFDTGKYAVGGRCSSRDRNDPQFPILSKSIYDHAIQLLAIPSSEDRFSEFRQQVKDWEREKVILEYPKDSIYSIDANGNVTPKDTMKAFYGSKGFGFIPKTMAQTIADIRQDVWVSPANGVRRKDSKWLVSSNGKPCGSFDRLIIAHNGKCADRLMSKTPAKQLHRLLRVNFGPNIPKHGGTRMTLNSIYSLTFALSSSNSPLSKRLPPTFVCGDLQEPNLRFLTCQTKKYPRDDDVEVWTLLSSPNFAKKRKAPQESLSEEIIETVTSNLLGNLERLLGLPSKLKPLESRVQLWGAAVPINTWQNGKGFIYDAEHEVGVCGDWLVEPSIAGAWTSGYHLATHMMQTASPSTVGLEGKFVKSFAAQQGGLAAFPESTGSDVESMQT